MRSKNLVFVFAALLITAGVFIAITYGNSGGAQTKTTKKISSQTSAATSEKNNITQNKPVPPAANVDIVYYFMTTQRCSNCIKIEAYTREAIENGFADAFKRGTMVWRMVNVDESANNHFIKDYQLYTKSVVLVKMRNGKQVEWKNLDQIWPLLNDKTGFQKYVTDEVKKFVGKS